MGVFVETLFITMDAEEIDAAAAAAELNILGGLASVTGLQSPAPTRPAGATANDASKDEALLPTFIRKVWNARNFRRSVM